MGERPQYTRSQIRALGGGDLLEDSDDDHASFHSNNTLSSTNTIVRRFTHPILSISLLTRAQSAATEATILNLLPDEQSAAPVPHELGHLRSSQPFPAPDEEYTLTTPRPSARRPSLICGNSKMRDKPTSMSMEYYYASPPTPQDDRPFVLYALDQITRDAVSGDGSRDGGRFSLGGGDTTRVASWESTWSEVPSVVLRNPAVEVEKEVGKVEKQTMKFNPKESLASLALPDSGESIYIPVDHLDRTRTGRPLSRDLRSRRIRKLALDFLPQALRPWSRRLLALAIIAMIAGILFCAEYSRRNNGLLEHTEPFDGRYVICHYLFPILAAGLYLWIQGVIATLFRIAAFVTLTRWDAKKRREGIFLNMHPSSMLRPRPAYFRQGQQLLAVISFLTFPVLLTIPLASYLFTFQCHNDIWRYTANLPVAYTLLAIYILALVSLFGLTLYFTHFTHRRLSHLTGLRWDPRSLGDVIALLSRSKCMEEYRGTEILGTEDMKGILGERAERLGYWTTTKPTQDEFYGIGVEGGPARRFSVEGGRFLYPSTIPRGYFDVENGGDLDSEAMRHAYCPWYLTKCAVILWPMLFGALYLALLVVSFYPNTTITNGFSPGLNAKPDAAGFSRSNFLYSFIPALLGMGLFVGMQKLYFTLARLYPWAELQKDGGEEAGRSLLLEYSASCSVPFSSLVMAARNGHWMIAALSVMGPLSIVIPILAGGCFATFTAIPSRQLLVFPHTSAFYTLLVLLGFYLVTLIVVAVGVLGMGTRLRMPKQSSCLADITSFLYASGVLGDAAFQGVVSGVDLRTRLLTARERGGGEVRYYFGTFLGKDGERHLGVERVGRMVDGEKLGLRMQKRRSGRDRKRRRGAGCCHEGTTMRDPG